MKKIIALTMSCLLLTLSLSGCKANDVVKNNLQKAELDLKTTEEELKTVGDEKVQLEKDLTEVTDKATELEGLVQTLQEELDAANQIITEIESSSLTSTSYVITALSVMDAIANNDFATVSTYVHPTLGVRFSPYTNIDTVNDILFTGAQLNTISTNTSTYLWGVYDGSGLPINLDFANYYDEFIYDEDFINFQILGNNTIAMTGNLTDNQLTAYPTAKFVDFHFPGFDPQYDGLDWVTLRLVFEEVSGIWYLVGVVHGQWTI